jgi:hypothetical protein
MLSEECIEYLHSLDTEHPGEKGIRYSRYIEALIWDDKARREPAPNLAKAPVKMPIIQNADLMK